jgi:hypothetical protein
MQTNPWDLDCCVRDILENISRGIDLEGGRDGPEQPAADGGDPMEQQQRRSKLRWAATIWRATGTRACRRCQRRTAERENLDPILNEDEQHGSNMIHDDQRTTIA